MVSKSINEQIAEQIFTLSRLMKEEMTFDSLASQLTILQLQALIFISRNEEVTMTELSNHFSISLPTATSLSNKLVTAKLIKRQSNSADRRIVKLLLTSKGEDLLEEAMKQRSAKLSTMLSYMSQIEKEQLLDIMKNLIITIQNHEK